jgi:hypothetical protein
VVGEPGDVVAGLRRDLCGKGLLLRIRGAGEEEVLPDQQTQLVGEVIEVVRLVNPAAPDPDVVDVGVDGNVSSGIQFTPLTKTGTSLTTSVNGVPPASGAVSQRAERKPIRCRRASSWAPSSVVKATSRS